MKKSKPDLVAVKTNRNFTMRTVSGHTIAFVKDVETPIPRFLLDEAMAQGAVPVQEADIPNQDENRKPTPAPSGAKRKEAIITAIEELVAAGNRSDFNASGRVDVKVLKTKLGFDVTAKERDAIWDELMATSEED